MMSSPPASVAELGGVRPTHTDTVTMHKYTKFVIASMILLSGCGKRAGVVGIPYQDEIESGLTRQFNYVAFPRGDIQIMSGLSSQMEPDNPAAKRFSAKYLEFLQASRNAGLVQFSEKQQSQLDQIRSMGTRILTVTPTPLAIEQSDKQLSNKDYVNIRTGTCRIQTIVKDIEFHNPALATSDDFRLVVGTYERSFTDFAVKKLGNPDKKETYKFRALVKVNPFNHTYSFQTADWGNISEDGWQSNSIPN